MRALSFPADSFRNSTVWPGRALSSNGSQVKLEWNLSRLQLLNMGGHLCSCFEKHVSTSESWHSQLMKMLELPLTSLPLTRIQEYNIPLAANKFSNFSPTHLNKPKTLSLLATRTSTNQFPVSYSSWHHSLPNDESPFSCDSTAGRCGEGRYIGNVSMFRCHFLVIKNSSWMNFKRSIY